MAETQQSIWEWVTKTFGDHAINSKRLQRFKEECAEFIIAVEAFEKDTADLQTVAEEAADVYLTLAATCSEFGIDLATEVNTKMFYNRSSEFVQNADGRIVRKGKETGPPKAIPTVSVHYEMENEHHGDCHACGSDNVVLHISYEGGRHYTCSECGSDDLQVHGA